MKVFAAFVLVISGFALVGCQSESSSPRPADLNSGPPYTTPSPTPTAPKPEIAVGYDWRNENWGSQDQSIVELELGTLPADDLAVCHSSYVIGKLSNRKADGCDKIAARGLALHRRQAAAEKVKDDAYDKAHTKK
jgi:hypothetical protein